MDVFLWSLGCAVSLLVLEKKNPTIPNITFNSCVNNLDGKLICGKNKKKEKCDQEMLT